MIECIITTVHTAVIVVIVASAVKVQEQAVVASKRQHIRIVGVCCTWLERGTSNEWSHRQFCIANKQSINSLTAI